MIGQITGSQLGVILLLRAHVAMSGDILCCQNVWRGGYYLVVRTRMLCFLSTMHRKAPTIKNFLVKNINSARLRNPDRLIKKKDNIIQNVKNMLFTMSVYDKT